MGLEMNEQGASEPSNKKETSQYLSDVRKIGKSPDSYKASHKVNASSAMSMLIAHVKKVCTLEGLRFTKNSEGKFMLVCNASPTHGPEITNEAIDGRYVATVNKTQLRLYHDQYRGAATAAAPLTFAAAKPPVPVAEKPAKLVVAEPESSDSETEFVAEPPKKKRKKSKENAEAPKSKQNKHVDDAWRVIVDEHGFEFAFKFRELLQMHDVKLVPC